ncbi:MAG: Cof-type HAD-IIB family hydrolase [Oliverpabstia sp.]|nr:Cof-type HAD-IIB family hydrolase [Eubacterium sp.]MDY2594091.1 Cof-type HAD-IIB family hydrolase [Oliverpabstia sp.]
MEKRKIRMIGLDLDGTVFNNAKVITEHTREVLTKAIRQGVVVLPATGRPECGLPEQFLAIPGVRYALTSNGARIIDLAERKVIYAQLLPWETAAKVIDEVSTWEHCAWEAYYDGEIFVDADAYRFLDHPDMLPALKSYMRRTRQPVKHLAEKIRREHISMEKMHMVFENTEYRDQKMQEIREKFPGLAFSHATTFNMEINSSDAGKGKGLVALGKILGISREEIMACGDAANDWDMLQMAGFPVVMGNADEETKKLAAFVTKSNEEDGVAYAVEQYVLR